MKNSSLCKKKLLKKLNNMNKDIVEEFGVLKSVKKASKSTKKGISSAAKTVENTANDAANTIENTANDVANFAEGVWDETFGGVLSAIKEIKNLINDIIDFISGIDDFFIQFWDGMTFLDDVDQAFAILMTVTIPFFGQLYARFALYNGSMADPYMFLFFFPPLTLYPALMMMFGFFDKGDNVAPWDYTIWLPVAASFIGSLMVGISPKHHITKTFLVVLAFFLTYWYKSTEICSDAAPTNKLMVDSIISYAVVIVLSIGLPYIPYIGFPFKLVEMAIPMGNVVTTSVSIALVYIIMNIINITLGSEHCKAVISDNDLYKILIAGIALTAAVAFGPNPQDIIMTGMSKMQGMQGMQGIQGIQGIQGMVF